jgi:nitrogen fixation/metabolism regulation signal transduction histidine kinase
MISLKIVTKPIKELSNAAQNIAKGDFDIEIKSRGKNEISELICNFNLMVKAFKDK